MKLELFQPYIYDLAFEKDEMWFIYNGLSYGFSAGLILDLPIWDA